MKTSFAIALCASVASIAAAAVVPRGHGELTYAGHVDVETLKWHRGPGRTNWGYIAFDYRKDEQGRPIATTTDKDCKSAATKFEFVRVSTTDGSPGYMGRGDGKLGGGGEAVGHLRLHDDNSKCLTVATLDCDQSNLVLDDCSLEDGPVQRRQMFVATMPNRMYLGLIAGTQEEIDAHKTKGGHLTINEHEDGKPFQISFTQKKSTHNIAWGGNSVM